MLRPNATDVTNHNQAPFRDDPTSIAVTQTKPSTPSRPPKRRRTTTRATAFLRGEMTTPELVPCLGSQAVVFTTRSPDKPTPNEDAAVVIPVRSGCAVLAVADGVGGLQGGYQAAGAAVRAMVRSLADVTAEEDLRPRILDGFEQANQTILRHSTRGATTLSVVELSNGWMRPYHVGDSTIIQVGPKGEVKWIALEHSPVAYAVESGLMDEAEAIRHPDRNIVFNVVGDPEMHIEVGPRRRWGARDTLVLASDGLTDNLLLWEIADLARRNPFSRKITQLIQTARARMEQAIRAPTSEVPGKPDDLTVIAYRRQSKQRPGQPKGKTR